MKETTSAWSRIFKLAFPIMVSNIVAQIQMLIDKIFLGRLGLTATSAVGNATGPMWTTMSTIFALTLGGTILVSQAIGANEMSKAKSIMSAVFKYNNVLSVFWFFFWILGAPTVFKIMNVDESVIGMSIQYVIYFSPIFLGTGIASATTSLLQVCERTKIMLFYGIIRSGINVVLDYGFIFGNLGLPKMGVAGAALATTIAEFIGLAFIIIFVVRQKDFLIKPTLKEILGARISDYWSAAKVGIPSALEEFCWNLGNLFLIVMLNFVSAEAAGIFTIVFSVELLPVAVVTALGQATVTLSGQEVGRNHKQGVGAIVWMSYKACLVLSAFIMLLFLAVPRPIMSAFTTDASVIAAAGIYLAIVGVNMFPKAANIIVGAGIRGYGDTKWMLKTQIFGTIFTIVGSACLVLGLHYGLTALFCLVVADECLRSGLNYWKLRRKSVE